MHYLPYATCVDGNHYFAIDDKRSNEFDGKRVAGLRRLRRYRLRRGNVQDRTGSNSHTAVLR